VSIPTDHLLGRVGSALAGSELARQVEESRGRDDRRGARIIDDHAEAHPPASEDEYVRQAWDQTRALCLATDRLLRRPEEQEPPAVSGLLIDGRAPSFCNYLLLPGHRPGSVKPAPRSGRVSAGDQDTRSHAQLSGFQRRLVSLFRA
jgi:hypothetical protein